MRKLSQFLPHVSIFREFLKNIQQTGAIAPDSEAVVTAFCNSVPCDPKRVIVEYGPGTGTISREIINRKHAETTLICFEKNIALYESLRRSISEKNVFLVNEDAFDSPTVLSERFNLDFNSVDCLISSLPNTFLDYNRLITDKIHPLLKENGFLVTYQYVTSKFKSRGLKRALGKCFQNIEKRNVLWNLPPATVYTCRNKRTEGRPK